MPKSRPKSWVEKRNGGKPPHITTLEKPFAGMPQGCRMLVSSPQEIDEFIRQIPAGTVVTPAEMRQALAKKHGAEATCPVSTGIFLRIACEAAIEEKANGTGTVTPFWRMALYGTTTLKKLSIDAETLAYLRDSE